MNRPNNKRKKESRRRLEKAFLELMQTRELHDISVTEICEMAHVNRTTFYANYADIYDMAHKVLETLAAEVDDLYIELVSQGYSRSDVSRILRHIYENQLYYKTCFKLGIGDFPIKQYDAKAAEYYFQSKNITYHLEFFRGGFNRLVTLWLEGGCKETPEEIEEIIKAEYQRR